MSTSRIRSNPLALVILTLLSEAPMHPYEMQVKMRERGHRRVVRIKAASIYDTVGRLVRHGLAEVVETSREGRRPERTVYRLTEAGHDEMLAWLRDLIEKPVADFRSFEAGLTFLVALEDKDLAIELLTRRAKTLSEDIAASDATLAEIHGVPRMFLIEEEYAQALRRAELEWVRGIVDELKSGRLEWPEFPVWEERRDQ
ncbi:MAG TPA: PadR family transcriptional regulator [Candidatus Dormibacteraeota bacterium]